MYNDQLPNGSWTEVYGHSKGVFAYDATSAFWIQHSIPTLPEVKAKGYNYGSSQLWYGQHAFCISLPPAALNAVAGIMRYAFPQVYDYALVDPLLSNVTAIVKGGHVLDGAAAEHVPVGWGEVVLTGKASALGKDMLDLITAPKLQV